MQPVFPFAFSEKEPTNQAEKETKAAGPWWIVSEFISGDLKSDEREQ